MLTNSDSFGNNYPCNRRRLRWERDVRSYSTGGSGEKPWVICLLKSGKLLVLGGQSRVRSEFLNVADFSYSDEGRMLALIQVDTGKENSRLDILTLDDSGIERLGTVWSGRHPSNLTFCKERGRLVFEAATAVPDGHEIWTYTLGMKEAHLIVCDTTCSGMPNDLVISGRSIGISSDANRIFFDLQRLDKAGKAGDKSGGVAIWSIKDDQMLVPGSRSLWEGGQFMKAVFLLQEKRVILLSDLDDLCKFDEWGKDEYMLTWHKLNVAEGYRRKEDRPDVFLVDSKSGKKICIARQLLYADPHLSNMGKYAYWYDPTKRAYFTYNIADKKTINITQKVPALLYDECWDVGDAPRSYGIAGWMQEDKGIIIKDRYDLWLCDPNGMRPPLNITHGFGRKHHIIFRLLYINPVNVYSVAPLKQEQ